MHQPSWIENVAIAVFAVATLPVVINVLSRIVLPQTGLVITWFEVAIVIAAVCFIVGIANTVARRRRH